MIARKTKRVLPLKNNLRKREWKNSSDGKIPRLRFSPTAWAKLLYLRDLGPTEIGGFGISAPDDPFFVRDARLVAQRCTAVTVAFDDGAVADFFDEQVDQGLHPQQFSRIWIHTHPGRSARPSLTDEATFKRVFGTMDWAVMFILARGGETYTRLQFNVGPGAQLETGSEIDFQQPFTATGFTAWHAEYCATVQQPLDADSWWESEALDPFLERRFLEFDTTRPLCAAE